MSQLYQIQQKLFSWHPFNSKLFVRDPEGSFTRFPRYAPHVVMFYYEKRPLPQEGGDFFDFVSGYPSVGGIFLG